MIETTLYNQKVLRVVKPYTKCKLRAKTNKHLKRVENKQKS